MRGLFMVTLAFFAGLTLLTLLPQGVAMAGYDNTATSNTQLSRLDELSGSEAQLYRLPTPLKWRRTPATAVHKRWPIRGTVMKRGRPLTVKVVWRFLAVPGSRQTKLKLTGTL